MRPDLSRFTPEVLATLANMGLVKRAQRELAAGQTPELSEPEGGGLNGQFADGVLAFIPAGATLDQSRCTCGASGICRHRIALILHAREQHDTPPEPVGSPRDIDLAALRDTLPRRYVEAADRLRARGLVVEIEFADGRSSIASARLPMATVRFLGGADVALARCDCVQGGRCEHLLLAVEAFQQATPFATDSSHARVEWRAQSDTGIALGPALGALLEGLCELGLQAGPEAHAQAMASALEHARALGATWLVLALESLEDWLLSHAARSAAATPEAAIALLAELQARTLAARGQGAVSARAALGLDEPMESALDRTRLVSLGCRIRDLGGRREARVALLDINSATLLALDSTADISAPTAVSDRRVGSQLRLGALARGQIVTTTLHRRANGQIRFGASWGGRVSLTPQNGDWSGLPASWVHDGPSTLLRRRRESPPALIAPRHLLDGFAVIACSEVVDLAYDPVRQSVHAQLRCMDGSLLRIERSHSGASAGALDAIHACCTGIDAPFRVAGVLRFDHSGAHLDPWALATRSGLCVPDLTPLCSSLAAAPIHALPEPDDPLIAPLLQAQDLLIECLLDGRRRARSGWRQRVTACAHALETAMYSRTAGAMSALADAMDADGARFARALAELALQLWLCFEQAALGPEADASADACEQSAT